MTLPIDAEETVTESKSVLLYTFYSLLRFMMSLSLPIIYSTFVTMFIVYLSSDTMPDVTDQNGSILFIMCAVTSHILYDIILMILDYFKFVKAITVLVSIVTVALLSYTCVISMMIILDISDLWTIGWLLILYWNFVVFSLFSFTRAFPKNGKLFFIVILSSIVTNISIRFVNKDYVWLWIILESIWECLVCYMPRMQRIIRNMKSIPMYSSLYYEANKKLRHYGVLSDKSITNINNRLSHVISKEKELNIQLSKIIEAWSEDSSRSKGSKNSVFDHKSTHKKFKHFKTQLLKEIKLFQNIIMSRFESSINVTISHMVIINLEMILIIEQTSSLGIYYAIISVVTGFFYYTTIIIFTDISFPAICAVIIVVYIHSAIAKEYLTYFSEYNFINNIFI